MIAALQILVLSVAVQQPLNTVLNDTGSMKPEYQDYEPITILPARIEDIRVGDDISYRAPDGWNNMHRVIRIRHAANGGIGLIVQALASKIPDRTIITRAEFVGRVVKTPKP